MHHHGWELYRLLWTAYDALSALRGNLFALIPLGLTLIGLFYLYRRRK